MCCYNLISWLRYLETSNHFRAMRVGTLVLVARRNFTMLRFEFHRYLIKFCVDIKKTRAKTVAILKEAYNNNALSDIMVYLTKLGLATLPQSVYNLKTIGVRVPEGAKGTRGPSFLDFESPQ